MCVNAEEGWLSSIFVQSIPAELQADVENLIVDIFIIVFVVVKHFAAHFLTPSDFMIVFW